MISTLVEKIKKTNAPICVGLDPMMDYVPGIVLVVNGTIHNGTVMNNTEMADIYGTWDLEGSVTYTWKLLNDPCITIPGYADLDEKYGVLGQAVKFAGWLFFGIDDKQYGQ